MGMNEKDIKQRLDEIQQACCWVEEKSKGKIKGVRLDIQLNCQGKPNLIPLIFLAPNGF